MVLTCIFLQETSSSQLKLLRFLATLAATLTRKYEDLDFSKKIIILNQIRVTQVRLLMESISNISSMIIPSLPLSAKTFYSIIPKSHELMFKTTRTQVLPIRRLAFDFAKSYCFSIVLAFLDQLEELKLQQLSGYFYNVQIPRCLGHQFKINSRRKRLHFLNKDELIIFDLERMTKIKRKIRIKLLNSFIGTSSIEVFGEIYFTCLWVENSFVDSKLDQYLEVSIYNARGNLQLKTAGGSILQPQSRWAHMFPSSGPKLRDMSYRQRIQSATEATKFDRLFPQLYILQVLNIIREICRNRTRAQNQRLRRQFLQFHEFSLVDSKQFQKFDENTCQFIKLSPMKFKRFLPTITSCRNRYIIVASYNNEISSEPNTCEMYDIVQDHWVTLPNLIYTYRPPKIIVMKDRYLYKFSSDSLKGKLQVLDLQPLINPRQNSISELLIEQMKWRSINVESSLDKICE